MAQLNIADINVFRNLAEQGGNIIQTQAGLVHGKSGTWIRAALNIGTSRKDNANTLSVLRLAIANEPRYAQVLNQVEAQLGRINIKYPISSAKVRNILGALDTAVNTLAGNNKEQTYSLIMRYIGPDTIRQSFEQAARDANRDQNLANVLTADQKSKFIKYIGDRIIAAQGDFLHVPDNNEIKNRILTAANEINRVNERLINSLLSDDEKNIMRESMFDGSNMLSADAVIANIYDRENLIANEQLAIDYSNNTLEGKFIQELKQQLVAAGLSDKMPEEKALHKIQMRIKEHIINRGRTEAIRLTPEMAADALRAGVQGYITALQTARQLPDNEVSLFMQNVCQKNAGDLDPVYIQRMAQMRQQVSLQGLMQLPPLANQTQLGNAVQRVLGTWPNDAHLPPNMHGEDSQGRREYVELLISSAIASAHISQVALQNIYNHLTQGAGKSLMAHLVALDTTPINATTSTFLEDLTYVFGAALQKKREDIEYDLQAPAANIVTIGDGLVVHTKNNPIQEFNNSKTKLIKNFQSLVALETAKMVLAEEETMFSKDLNRHPSMRLDGVPVNNNPDQETLPQDMEDNESNRKLILLQSARNRYTAFVTGNPEDTFINAPQKVKNKINIITSLLNQETEKLLLHASFNAIFQDYGSEDILLSYHQTGKDIGTRDISITKEQDVAFTFSFSLDVPLDFAFIKDQDEPIMLDRPTSRHKAAMTFTITQESLDNLANQDWRAFTEQGLNAIRTMSPEDLPANMCLDFTGFDVSTSLSMFIK